MPRIATRIAIALVVTIALLIGTAIMSSAGGGAQRGGVPAFAKSVPSTTIRGNCRTRAAAFASSDEINASTTSTNFVDVPGMSVNFTVHAERGSCLAVLYTANVFTGAGTELIYVRALLDGVTAGFPGEAQFEGDSDEDSDGAWARAHAFNFVFEDVPAGAHNVKIQWRSFFGGTVFTHWRTMVVSHT